MSKSLNSAAAIGSWLHDELSSNTADPLHAIRVITREVSRWFSNGLDDDAIAELVSEEPDSGDARWNALLEGVVARKLHEHRLKSPAWTRRTQLEVGWNPYESVASDPDWYQLDVFRTPVELLEKGVVFPREALRA